MAACECGCGQEVKRRFVSSHNLRVQENCAFRADVSLKKSIGQKAAMARKSPEVLALQFQRMRDTIRARFTEPEHHKAYADRMRQRWREPKFIKAVSESIPKRAQAIKRAWDNLSDEQRAERMRARALGAGIHPNSQEQRLDCLLQAEFPNEFEINVSNSRVIAGKMPDFIHVHLPVVIELFGTYWHGVKKTGRDNATEERLRRLQFSRHGYRLIVIWERELDNQKLVTGKIRKALSRRMYAA